MSQPSRPSRPGFTPPAPVAGGTSTFEALRASHEELVRRRGRLEGLQEEAQAQLKACEAEAQRLGVHSLEELEALIERQEAEDRQALAKFEADLQAEADLQRRVEAQLAEVGS